MGGGAHRSFNRETRTPVTRLVGRHPLNRYLVAAAKCHEPRCLCYAAEVICSTRRSPACRIRSWPAGILFVISPILNCNAGIHQRSLWRMAAGSSKPCNFSAGYCVRFTELFMGPSAPVWESAESGAPQTITLPWVGSELPIHCSAYRLTMPYFSTPAPDREHDLPAVSFCFWQRPCQSDT